ncbi:FkbM family methyltransferase [Ruegeria pomeroyi]|uniref:FkbM family methyltransferase n=1 Tax=Ruegeria pomeroyi TaxID=89184 RepID=UPI001EEE2D44|nr:FkbM family methyltransferase [Ruegeria pomeroyi]MCE8507638.1 FkbM family methyltransferase [Ruegeria pomeroyi]
MADGSQTNDGKFLVSRGMRFPLDPDILPKRVRVLLRTDGYEAKEARAAYRLIKEGDVVMELGAGIGFMSTLIATKTRAAEVHCFEANPRLIPYIEAVHAANDVTNAHIHHALLGDKPGRRTFYQRASILDSSLDPLPEDDETVEKVQVPVRGAAKALADIRPSVLVCDIEGAEVELLPQLDLSGLRAMLIELHPQWVGKDGIAQVFEAMRRAGLVFFPRWSQGKVAVFRSDW